jgi:hypothetical protein
MILNLLRTSELTPDQSKTLTQIQDTLRQEKSRTAPKGTKHSTFGANIYPEVTYLFCRLPLVTLIRLVIAF